MQNKDSAAPGKGQTQAGDPAPDTQTRARFLQQPILNETAALKFMNEVQHHAVIVERGQTFVVTPTLDAIIGRERLDYSTFADIAARYSNRQVAIGPKRSGGEECVPLGKWWLQSFGRREFRGVVFDPANTCGPEYLNLWRGFAIGPKAGDWSLMREHIRVIVCRSDERLYTFLLDLLAAIVQHPDRLTGVVVILIGREGIGKGVFVNAFGSLFAAAHFLPIHDVRHLVGAFNAHLQSAVVVFLDEAVGFEDRHANAKVRALATEPTLLVEAKFKNPIHAKNVCHLFIASNERHVVKANADARRFLVLDVDDKRRGETAYFQRIHEQMANGGRAAMLYELQRRQITSNFDHVPATDALFDTKLASMDAGEKWWFERLREGQLVISDGIGWRTQVLRKVLTEQYATAVGREHGKARATSTELGMLLKSLLPLGFPQDVQRTVRDEDRPGWNYVGLRAVERFWGVPALDVCRQHFSRRLRTELKW